VLAKLRRVWLRHLQIRNFYCRLVKMLKSPLVSNRYYVNAKFRQQQRLAEWMPTVEAVAPPPWDALLAFTLGRQWYDAIRLERLAELLPK
jgi:hypothetical protein